MTPDPDLTLPADQSAAPKSIFASKTIWLAIVAAIIPMLHAFGFKLIEDADAEQIATALSAVVGIVATILARRKTTPVTLPGAGSVVPMLALCLVGSMGFPLAGCNLTPEQTERLKTFGWNLAVTAIKVGLAVAGEKSPEVASAVPALQAAVDTAASDPAATPAGIAAALKAAAEANIKDSALRDRTVAIIKAQLIDAANKPAAAQDATEAVNARGVAAAL